MELLEALAAFALAMLLFSTIVTAIIEVVLNRILKLRQRRFRTVLERLYDDVLAPRLESRIEGLRSAGRDPRGEFLDAITRNPGIAAPRGDTGDPPQRRSLSWRGAGRAAMGWCGLVFSSNRIATLDAVSFAERLADTQVGKLIAAEARARRDALIDDVALKFERFGDGAREYFGQRARTLSIFAAIAFCLFANIDAANLFDGFLEDPTARAAFLARAETITEAYEEGAADAAARREAPPEKVNPPGSDADASLEQMRELAESVKTQIADLDAMSLRIGWGYFPWCEAGEVTEEEAIAVRRLGGYAEKFATGTDSAWIAARAVDDRCDARFDAFSERMGACVDAAADAEGGEDSLARCLDQELRDESVLAAISAAPGRDLAAWVFYCVVTGFLVGLGGPFWFNVYSNLSRVTQVARQVRGALGRRDAKPEREVEPREGGARKPADPVEAFERAAAANGIRAREVAPGDWEAWRARMRGRVTWIPR